MFRQRPPVASPCCSSSLDAVFSLLRARVQSLVRELRSRKPWGIAKKKKKKHSRPLQLRVCNIYKCVVQFMGQFEQNPWRGSPELLFENIPPVTSCAAQMEALPFQ